MRAMIGKLKGSSERVTPLAYTDARSKALANDRLGACSKHPNDVCEWDYEEPRMGWLCPSCYGRSVIDMSYEDKVMTKLALWTRSQPGVNGR
jgi:hypothetical protein